MGQQISAKANLKHNAAANVRLPNNPGPKLSADQLAELCQSYAAEAVVVLVDIMRNPELAASSRTAAAVTVIERGFGRAAQQINTTHTDMTALHLAALREVASAAQHSAIDVTPLPANPFQVTDKSSDPT